MDGPGGRLGTGMALAAVGAQVVRTGKEDREGGISKDKCLRRRAAEMQDIGV